MWQNIDFDISRFLTKIFASKVEEKNLPLNNLDRYRNRMIRRVVLIEGLANFIVLMIKAIVGFKTGSLAILSDALHSLADLANNIIILIVIRLSNQAPDREHPYGHRKFETIAVFGLATLLTVVAFELTLNAFKPINTKVISEPWGIILMLGVLTINIVLASWQRYWARKLKSEILLADASHTLGDVLTTLVVIAGWQLSTKGYLWLDRLTALIVVVLILYLAFGLFKRVIPVLVDQISVEPEKLTAAIERVPGVHRVVRVRSRWIGSSKAVDIVVTVDPKISTADSHAIADAIEAAVEKKFDVNDITVHIESENKSSESP